jgi:hypothetical protein
MENQIYFVNFFVEMEPTVAQSLFHRTISSKNCFWTKMPNKNRFGDSGRKCDCRGVFIVKQVGRFLDRKWKVERVFEFGVRFHPDSISSP